jgi:hypothetical protein
LPRLRLFPADRAHLSPFRTCPASRPARSPQTAHRNATGGAASRTQGRTRPARADAMAGGCGAFPAIAPAPCPARRGRSDAARLPIVRRHRARARQTIRQTVRQDRNAREPVTVRRQTVRTYPNRRPSGEIATDGAQERHRARRQIGTGANPSGANGRKGGRLPPCFRETVRTCHRFTDRHGTGAARSRQTVRTCPAARQIGRKPERGHGMSGERLPPVTCPADRTRHGARARRTVAADCELLPRLRLFTAVDRGRRRKGTPQAARRDRDGRESVRHRRAQWRAVAARFRRDCPADRAARLSGTDGERLPQIGNAARRRTLAANLSGRPCGEIGTPANLSPFRTCPADRTRRTCPADCPAGYAYVCVCNAKKKEGRRKYKVKTTRTRNAHTRPRPRTREGRRFRFGFGN